MPDLDPDQTAGSLRRSDLIARLMDDLVTIPGTRIGIGVDALIGLVPGVGDSAGAVLSGAILVEAVHCRVPHTVLMRMGANLLIDTLIGLLPGVGDVADIGFRANRRNTRLLRACVDQGRRVESSIPAYLVGAVAIVAATVMMLLASLVFTVWLLWTWLSAGR